MKAGIKESELKDLAMDIMKIADSINNTLNNFDNRFYDLKPYYEGKAYNDLNQFYSNVRKKYPVVKKNLNTYSDDFIALIRKMREGSIKFEKMFEAYTDDIKKRSQQFSDSQNGGNII